MADSAARRVVITGLGVVSPIGTGKEETWSGLMECRSTAHRIRRFDPEPFAVQIACEIPDFDPSRWMEHRDARRFDRAVQFAVAASQMALEDASLQPAAVDRDRAGVIVGSGAGGLETIFRGHMDLFEKGPMRVNPLTGAMMLPDMAAGQVAIMTGFRGPNFCVVSACATGSNAIGEAAEIIKRGDADVMLAGSTEAGLTPFGVAAFHRVGAVSTRNAEPERASRPFDVDRDGFVFGEGAGMVVLETVEHARARGAVIQAELAGYGTTADAFHISAPAADGSGAALAMRNALIKARAQPEDVDYINAHGTGTPLNDISETRAIKLALGDHAYSVPISSTKSMHGHLLGAAGSLEAAITVMVIERGVIPPTINLDTPDPDCDLDYVPLTPRRAERPVDLALSNSFGFGGHNACVAIRRWVE
jgi:3-oxoacyl-[acyl-carrier-protein] synthase II